ncbi:MAG: T9SS type A sorting domain-containing protein [Flavobacteriales bacterium]|nr:T9SS type A sorting domain-containing protein [Flavobacteriales bacterium]
MLLLSGLAKGQTVSQYSFGSAIGTWSGITGGTQLDANTFDDEVYAAQTIPAFPFAGTYYTTMYVSPNGFITFGSAAAATNYTPISSNATYAGAISAFGLDVTDAGSGTREIRWQTVGNEIVVQWLRARRINQSESIDFQIRLNTTTGAISIVYNNSAPSSSTAAYPQVGLRGVNNTMSPNVNNRAVDQTGPTTGWSWSVSRAGTANTDVCRYNNTNTATVSRSPANGLTYTWTPPCLPPTTSAAGPDQTICAAGTATLAANTPSLGTGAWTIAGPNTSTAQLSSSTNPTAVFTPTTTGTYTLTWTISNGVCTASADQVVITVNTAAPAANAGPDNTLCITGGALAANAASPGTGAWTVVSGPSLLTSQFSSTSSATSTFTGVSAGVYTLRWTITRTGCTTTQDDVVITVNPSPTAANAGGDQAFCFPATATMAAVVPSVGTGSWTAISSGGLGQLSSTTANDAVFTPATSGTYTLTWTTSNSPCANSTDQVVIAMNNPVAADAGVDKTACQNPGSVTMTANTITGGSGLWTKTSGGSATITNNTLAGTTVTGLTAAGSPYVFRWTATVPGCGTTFDEVGVVVDAVPVANAGTDQNLCLSAISTNLAAVGPSPGSGSWTAISSGGLGQISPLNSNTATFTPATTGTYTLTWTASNGVCANTTDNVTITVLPFASTPISQTFNADGNFVVPAGVTQITVQAWGGGAAGGGSTNAPVFQAYGGAGGGGGAYVSKTLTVTPGSTLSVQVADPVVGSLGANGNPGNPSTITGFESLVFAAGGSGGTANTAGGTPAFGAGGTTAASQGDTETPGGNGTNGGSNGGAGGAGANPSGGAGGGTVSGAGTTANGNNGTAPGGGGSGSRTSQSGGARTGGTGAAGRVIISYTPAPGVTASPATICQGGSTTLTASGGSSYLWSPGGATSSSIVVSPGSTATYSVTITNTCPALVTQQVTVDTPPVASITPGGPTSFCAPGSVTLNSSAGSSYLWSPGGATTQSINAVASGSYTVAVTAGVCTVLSPAVSVTAGTAPTLSNVTASPAVLCEEGNSQLNVTANMTYCASTHSSGCGSGNAIVSVVFEDLTNTSTCSGGSYGDYTSMSANLLAGNIYSAAITMGSDATQFAAIWIDWNADGDFYEANEFIGSSANVGANGTANFSIEVPLDAANGLVRMRVIGGNNAAILISQSCGASSSAAGETEDYSVSIAGGTGAGMTYLWAPGASLDDATSATPVAVDLNALPITFTVTASSSIGCTSQSTVTVTGQDAPDAGTDGSLTICEGSTVTASQLFDELGGTPDGGGAWSPALAGGGTYTYTVLAIAPCTEDATATVTVTEHDAPNAGGNGPDQTVCINAGAFDLFSLLTGSPDTDGSWSGPGPALTSGHAGTFTPGTNLAGTYTYTVNATAPCTGFVTASVTVAYNNTDTDNDGIINCLDNCPNVVGVIGSNCDAQSGPGFVLGQLNNACQCVQIACTESVVLELRTDAKSDEAGWEILDQNTNLVICSGGAPADPFPSGITSPITPECCLPVGCYRLRVLDSGGDGFVSGGITGGYQLREQGINGRRIIDNFGNFSSGSSSGIGSTFENGAFCVPVGSDRPIFASCDKLDWANNQFIVATENEAVSTAFGSTNTTSGYEFWFFDPNGGYSFRRFRNHATSDGFGHGATRACHMKLNSWSNSILTPHLPANVLLNVRIRGRVNGNNEPFGPACLFKIDAARAACPIVKLQDNPLNIPDFSCGVVKVFGGANSSANRITANPPQFSPAAPAGQIRYQFRFRIPGENVCIVRPAQSSPTLHLNWSGPGQLECSKSYDVDVRVSKDGGATWCVANGEPTCGMNVTPWGKVCAVTISTSTYCPGNGLVGGNNNLALEGDAELTMYPNPNHGEQVFINLSAVERDVNTISVDIYDLTGKRVIAKTVAVSDGVVNSALELNGDLNSGVYVVNITAGTKTYTQRLVIQK